MNYDKDEDPRAKAVNNNPCGICRTLGQPTCKGHAAGGGGGGASGDASEESTLSDTPTNTPNSTDLIATLEESLLWVAVEDAEDTFLFDDTLALFSITLDLSRGSLEFTKDCGLSKEEQKELEEFYSAIEREFNEFKAELHAQGIDTQLFQCNHENGNLIIKIPSPEHYDRFIQQLVDKNFLPTASIQMTHTKDIEHPKPEDEKNNQAEARTAPNPFNIDKGPRFGD